ncbi:MAG: acyltransferase [Polyangia bacterium]
MSPPPPRPPPPTLLSVSGPAPVPDSTVPYVGCIDGLRALSILWMIGFHVLFMTGYWLQPDQYIRLSNHPAVMLFAKGHLGVEIFFVLSGYLIARLLLHEQAATGTVRPGRFYLRRATRILPAYAVVLLLSGAVLGAEAHLGSAWANLLLLNNFLPFDAQALPWAWSLAVEEQFYLLFPLGLLAARRRTARTTRTAAPTYRAVLWLLALLALALALRAALVFDAFHVLGAFDVLGDAGGHAARGWLRAPMPFHPALDPAGFRRYFDAVYDKPYGRGGAILCGVLVAYLERLRAPLLLLNRHVRAARALLGLSALGLGIAAFLPTTAAPAAAPSLYAALALTSSRYAFAALVAGALLYALARQHAAAPSRLVQLLGLRGWRPIAELSYGAYLVHPLVIVVIWHELPTEMISPCKLAAAGLLTCAVTFPLAYTLHRLIERPFRQLGRRLTGAGS